MKNILLCLIVFFSCHLSAQVPSYVPSDGLVGYWPFNGNANDESGNENNGTVNGATLTADRFGVVNSAFFFDGIDDNILLPDLGFSDAFTISGYINTSSLASNEVFRSIIGDNDGWTNPDIHWGVTNELIYAKVAAQVNCVCVNEFTLNDCLEKWVHVVYSHDNNSDSKLYADGQLIGQITDPTLQASLQVLAIGSQFNNQRFWHGALDDFAIWSRALTEEEIAELYNAPSCDLTVDLGADTLGLCAGDSVLLDAGAGYNYYDWSTGDNTQSIYASTTGNYSVTVGDSVGVDNDYSMSFDGVDDYVELTDLSVLNQVTWACWIKPHSFSTGQNHFLSKFTSTTNVSPRELAFELDNGKVTINIRDNSIQQWHNASSSQVVNLN